MKKVLLSLITILFIASCSKKDDVDPNLAAQVEGTYKISSIESDGQTVTLPQGGISGELKISRIDDVSVDLWIALYNAGKIIEQDNSEVILSKSGDRILLKFEGDEIGYVEGKKIVLEDNEDGERTKIIASK
ncbi:hypothetical protein DYBT9275_04498 [Dyadobacter sp. CECT 9275]|uniref:Uncharacterized protein n=1 Tax=Dyadobacter helix TaxID=2822344 RepID=A0A916JFA8_9BACT|nr:hypothetical protein [Dyadobacter sp. CECT 9275]CAG5009436.1 hypothetical protein DYBT9275_04498 [Dyadobacter sp. CECT 9275]